MNKDTQLSGRKSFEVGSDRGKSRSQSHDRCWKVCLSSSKSEIRLETPPKDDFLMNELGKMPAGGKKWGSLSAPALLLNEAGKSLLGQVGTAEPSPR